LRNKPFMTPFDPFIYTLCTPDEHLKWDKPP